MTTFAKLGLLWGALLGASIGWGQTTPDAAHGFMRPQANAKSPVAARTAALQTSIVAGNAQPAREQQRGTRSPSNDDCANAYAFDLFPGSPVTFTDDNTGATEDCPALSGGVYREVWYKFTTYETLTVTVKYCGTSPAFYNAYIVMDPTCPCSGAFNFASSWDNYSCGDGNWTLYWMNLAPGTYYWPLLTDSAGGYAEGPYTVTFDPGDGWQEPPRCPDDSLYGQTPYLPMVSGYTSAVGPSFAYTVADNFSGVLGKIGDIHWWGLRAYFDPYYGWTTCADPTPFDFEVKFYQNGSQPGAVVGSYLVTPTEVDMGPGYWYASDLLYYSVDQLQPCVNLSAGWVSVQSQLHPGGCVFLWVNSPLGDYSSYQMPAGGAWGQLGTDMAFCLTGGNCPDVFGACCDDYTGVCNDGVEWGQCAPPLRFTQDTLCADLEPTCGIRGACCDAGLNCAFTGFEAECDAIGGRFVPGESCDTFVCPPVGCSHRVDLYDCYGDGWNGNTLDVLVNGVTVLSQITLPSGTGPLSFYVIAGTGDTIQTIYYPIGGWPYEPYYKIYDGLGFLLGSDGISGSNCYVQPTGIVVTGNCNAPTTGACCYFAGGCEMVPDAASCIDGEFLGLGHQCPECPCIVACPPGAIPEPEPCGENTDGGCGLDPPTFAPISCGDTVCGTLWATTEDRDTDWYELVTTDWNYFTWTAECEIPVLIVVMQAGPDGGCAGFTMLGSATAGACQPATFTTDALPAGKYWFWVGSSEWNDWPCEQHYTATLTCTGCPPYYCSGSGGCDEYIARVQIGVIDNSTSCTNYGNYTSLSTDLFYGAGTPLTVTNGNPIWTADYCRVWVDWNHDLVFGDDEIVGTVPGVGPYNFTVTPPGTALTGPTRMRIRIDYANANPSPCGTTSYGEVEDYTVNVIEVAGACCWDTFCENLLPSVCTGYWGGAFTSCAFADCNGNGIDDFCDIASGYSTDCDGNGIPDECQPSFDCNGNAVPDFCDIADGTSQDCNGNGIPDECDVPPLCQAGAPGFPATCSLDCQPDGIPDECQLAGGISLQIDDGTSEQNWGLTAGGELCWINHFVANPPGAVLVIGATFGTPAYPGSSGVVPGQSFRVYVWGDANGDGIPAGSDLLGEATGTVDAGSIDTDVVQTVTLATPVAVSSSFFIGCSVNVPSGYPATADDDGQSQIDQGFLTFNSIPFDPTNLTTIYPMSALGYPTTVFILRVVDGGSGDCNGNGIPDECDTGGGGPSEDCNGNLIPDECEPGGTADCDNDGTTDLCEIAHCEGIPWCSDCNSNYVPDACDIADGTSSDCNMNGVPDECDLGAGRSEDCNGNGILDECDIANCPPGESWCCDCQPNGIPDGCELYAATERYELLWDDGSSENSLGLTCDCEMCWLAHFTTASPGIVQGIKTCFGTPHYPGSSGVSAGQNVRVYVWSDPNDDGDPADAVFLSEATGVANGGSIDTDVFQTIAISQPVNGSFFVGASVFTLAGGYPAPMDENGPQHNQAWVAFNSIPFDPTNIGSYLYNMTDIGYMCNWLLRAEVSCSPPANDCNLNQIPDECDIGVQWGGYCTGQGGCFPTPCESDWNHNGIPDSCELCGDLDNDANVDLDDYWMFFDAYGTCVGNPKYNPAADMDGDGCVTLLDYQAWRMCYLMANGKEFVAPKPRPMPPPAKKTAQGDGAR
jgi:hypothetical protein